MNRQKEKHDIMEVIEFDINSKVITVSNSAGKPERKEVEIILNENDKEYQHKTNDSIVLVSHIVSYESMAYCICMEQRQTPITYMFPLRNFIESYSPR